MADGSLVAILVVAAYILLSRVKQRLEVYPYIIMAGLTSLLIAKSISILYQPSETRPFVEQGAIAGATYIPNPGFPSDHALLATVAILAVIVLTRNHTIKILLVALLVAMCIGRVLALVHTPLDVVAGVAFGCVGGIWYLAMPRRYRSV